MEKMAAGLRALAQESSSRSGGGGGYPAAAASGRSPPLIRATTGRTVSMGTCSKLCLFSFSIGVLVGFSLKRRLRRWAAKLLKRLKDDDR